MKKPKTAKQWILKIHEILGLTTGIVVFIVALTGCCWVFKKEFQSLYLQEWTVEVQDRPALAPTAAVELAGRALPGRHVHGALYGAPGSAVEVIFYEADPEFYQSVFLHPYSGEVLEIRDHFSGLFHFVLDGHMYLWLPEAIGEQIVAASALLFLLMQISGLVLWWPKKANRRQRLKFAWKEGTRWKRKNFDLHAIAGFYVLSLAFVLAFTGSVMAYDWFYYGVYKAAGGERTPRFIVPDNLHPLSLDTANPPIDRLVGLLQEQNPDAHSFEVHYPATDSSSIYVEITYREGVYYSSDYRFFDQSTLEEVETPSIYGRYADASFADKLMRMNYDIHVGAIGGLAGKIIAFLASALVATLPLSGFLLWHGRHYKNINYSEIEDKKNTATTRREPII